MNNPIKIGKGILEWVKETHYITGPITKKEYLIIGCKNSKIFIKDILML
jgi:hypothetical protein